MKCKVVFWKNWDATFGARIEVIEVEHSEFPYPTKHVFSENEVDWRNDDEMNNSVDCEVRIDWVSKKILLEWVEEIREDLQTLLTRYYKAEQPADYEFEIKPKLPV